MGIPVGGKSRLQLNIMLNGEYGTDWRNVIYKDQKVFPVTWMDYVSTYESGEVLDFFV